MSDTNLVFMPVMDITIATDRREQIVKFVQAIMVSGTDFGVIPGTNAKPTLLKPGAEKLTTFFGLTKRFEIIERIEDWTGKDHGGEPFFYYLYRCGLYRCDILNAEADGSCNSFESKYRWRKAGRVCPSCGSDAIRKSKQGGGWFCWAKLGGCGATFSAGDKSIESQELGRVVNPDVCDQVNTIQKMAQKRALIAATLLAVNASEFFTQDLEDYIIDGDFAPVANSDKPAKQESTPAPNTGNVPNSPASLLELVNSQVNVKYDSVSHLFNALKNVFGGFSWPGPKDAAGWGYALEAAIAHAAKKEEPKPEEDEVPF